MSELRPWRDAQICGLHQMADKSVDILLCDPPYDAHTHKSGRRGQLSNPRERSQVDAAISRSRELGFAPMTSDLMRDVAEQAARTVKRWSLVFCSLEMTQDWRAAFEAAGLEYVRTQIWHKRNAPPQFTGDRPANACEAIMTFHPFPPGRKRWNGGGHHGFYAYPIVLNRGKEKVRLHTAQKPIELMRDLVERFSMPDELVADPFAGAGSTLLACDQLGRKSIGWELDPNYIQVAQARLDAEAAKRLVDNSSTDTIVSFEEPHDQLSEEDDFPPEHYEERDIGNL